MTELITLPGISSSGEGHWQTLWEKADPTIRRFKPESWDQPELEDWIEALEDSVVSSQTPPVLIAHSLSCLLVAHWSQQSRLKLAGAVLTGIPDPAAPSFPQQAASFRNVPENPLRFPSLIVASSNDPYGTLDHSYLRASQWQSNIVLIGAHGHINDESGLGDWPEGLKLLHKFISES